MFIDSPTTGVQALGFKLWFRRLKQRKMSIKLIPDTGMGTTRDYVFSFRTVLLAKISAVLAAILLVVGISAIIIAFVQDAKIDRFRAANAQLRRDVSKVNELRETLAGIWMMNERLKTMMGRSPVSRKKNTSTRPLPWRPPLARWVGPSYHLVPTRHPELGVYLRSAVNALVVATAPGLVLDIRWTPAHGDMIIIRHGNGIQTRYARDLTILAKKGDVVAQGQTIGIINAVTHKRKPVLYYQIIMDGQSVSPLEACPALADTTGGALASR